MQPEAASPAGVATGPFWPGAGVPSANFVAREWSLKVHILTGWFRASDSESWRARIGQLQSFTYVCYQVTNSKPLQLVTSGVRLIPKAFATQMPEAPAGISALLDRIRKAP